MNCAIYCLLHIKTTVSVKKAHVKIVAYLDLPIFFLYTPLLLENRKFLQSLFSSANYTIDHFSIIYILRDYSSVRICFNTINKHHTLPIVYTILI